MCASGGAGDAVARAGRVSLLVVTRPLLSVVMRHPVLGACSRGGNPVVWCSIAASLRRIAGPLGRTGRAPHDPKGHARVTPQARRLVHAGPVGARRASPGRAAGAARWRWVLALSGRMGQAAPGSTGHARVTPTGMAVGDRGAVGGARATVPNPSHPVGATRASPIRAARRGNPPPRCPHAVEHPSPRRCRATPSPAPCGRGGQGVRGYTRAASVCVGTGPASGPDGPAGSGTPDPYGDGKRRLQVVDGSGTVPERPRPFLSSGLDRVRRPATPRGAGLSRPIRTVPTDPSAPGCCCSLSRGRGRCGLEVFGLVGSGISDPYRNAGDG